MSDEKTPAELVKNARTLLGWTQRFFGEHLGFSESSAKRWESGNSKIPYVILEWCRVVEYAYRIISPDWTTRFNDLVDEEDRSVEPFDMRVCDIIEHLGIAVAVDRIQEQLLLAEYKASNFRPE